MKRNIRYIRNGMTINEEEQKKLLQSSACILGCGGLGGYSIEMLARSGVGKLKVVDGDVFEITNLNRQLLSSPDVLGESKALTAKKYVNNINEEIEIIAAEVFINEDNCKEIIEGYDVVVDALDNIAARKIVAKTCRELDIPYVYGAIAGWYGQVATIMPDEKTLDILYPDENIQGDEDKLGNPSFTPAVVAGIQVSEVIKVLLSKGKILTGCFMHIDLLTNEVETIKFK